LKRAFKGGKLSPSDASLLAVYTISKELSISPLEVYQMPSGLVKDLLSLIQIQNELEQEEINKMK